MDANVYNYGLYIDGQQCSILQGYCYFVSNDPNVKLLLFDTKQQVYNYASQNNLKIINDIQEII